MYVIPPLHLGVLQSKRVAMQSSVSQHLAQQRQQLATAPPTANAHCDVRHSMLFGTGHIIASPYWVPLVATLSLRQKIEFASPKKPGLTKLIARANRNAFCILRHISVSETGRTWSTTRRFFKKTVGCLLSQNCFNVSTFII